MADDRNGGIGWFLAGLGLGALVGVLYAPRSGRETRESILNSFEDGRELLDTRGREARQQVGTIVQRGKETLSRQREHISSAIDAGRQAYREATSDKKS
jgi:gas vesicle protein